MYLILDNNLFRMRTKHPLFPTLNHLVWYCWWQKPCTSWEIFEDILVSHILVHQEYDLRLLKALWFDPIVHQHVAFNIITASFIQLYRHPISSRKVAVKVSVLPSLMSLEWKKNGNAVRISISQKTPVPFDLVLSPTAVGHVASDPLFAKQQRRFHMWPHLEKDHLLP